MTRRTLLAGPRLAAPLLAAGQRHRVAIIGFSGAGNFGHDWDTAWRLFPNVETVAVSDPVEKGRLQAQQRSGAARAYADYREMLTKERPGIVTIAPRWLDRRLEVFTAAAEAGAHMLLEKPFARSLADARLMEKMARERKLKIQVGHTARTASVSARVRELLRSGEIGTLLEIRARGKEDRRAGGEDLIVLGSHCLDLMRYFAGDPEWVSARVTSQGRDVTPSMEREGTEPVGRIAGDQIEAMFGFAGGVPGYWASRPSETRDGSRFGVTLYGSKGQIYVPLNDVPGAEPYWQKTSSWAGGSWERIPYAPGTELKTREDANASMAADLLDAIDRGREPACSAIDGRWTVEMIAGIYAAHYAGRRLSFPIG